MFLGRVSKTFQVEMLAFIQSIRRLASCVAAGAGITLLQLEVLIVVGHLLLHPDHCLRNALAALLQPLYARIYRLDQQ